VSQSVRVWHTTILDKAGIADYDSVIGYFAQTMVKDLRLFCCVNSRMLGITGQS
jgi:hypothetical protein